MVTVYYNPGMDGHISKFLKMTGLERYNTIIHWDKPVIWMGLYNLQDYLTFKFHEGPKLVYWLGSDVLPLLGSGLKWTSQNWEVTGEDLVKLIKSKNCTHICENITIHDELKSVGFDSLIRPFFLGNVDDFTCSYTPSSRPSVYTVVSSGDSDFYGVDWIYEIADRVEVDFHIYGHNGQDLNNVYHHFTSEKIQDLEGNWIDKIMGLPEQEFNDRIQSHQAFLRLPKHDGFSQSTMKAILMGQYVAERTPYDFLTHVSSPLELLDFLNTLSSKTDSNQEVHKLKEILNNFDWLDSFIISNSEELDEWQD